MKEQSLLFKKEVYAIIGGAIEVHRELGPGFLEAVYHEALEIEFTLQGIPYLSKTLLKIKYKSKVLNKRYEADFFLREDLFLNILRLADEVGGQRTEVRGRRSEGGMFKADL